MTDQQIANMFFDKAHLSGAEALDDLEAREQLKPRRLNPDEIAFIRAAATPSKNRWTGVCDVGRMTELVGQNPALLESVGPGLLHTTVSMAGCADAVKFLADHDVPLLIDETRYNSLHEATWANDCTDNLRHIFEAGLADAAGVSQERAHDGWPDHISLLFWSCNGGNAALTELLLDHGADIHLNLRFKNNGSKGHTALQVAVAPFTHRVPDPGWQANKNPGRYATAQVLIARGADYDLFSAAALDDVDQLKHLLDRDMEGVGATDEFNAQPLHWAARTGALKAGALLLKRGADSEARNKNKSTALSLAATAGQVDFVWLLAEQGADLNAADGSGRTPLHLATFNGRADAAEALIVLGANPRAKNRKGKTPLEVAQMDCRYLKPKAKRT